MDQLLLSKAKRHLARRDAVLKTVIDRIGICTLTVSDDHFSVLIHSIVSQQISGKAARAITARLREKVGRFQPKRMLSTDAEEIRSAGLSMSKLRSILDLSEKCLDGTVPLRKLREMEDAEIIERLTQVRGIGQWTAEMFLIFSLGRTDVLPVADYGLRAGMQKLHELDELPKKADLAVLTESWRPYRSIGTWYIWRSLGGVPQSK
jgi:DNA-3-methyladenine glycosylase II